MIEDPDSGGKVVSFSVLDSKNYSLYMQIIGDFKPDLVFIDTLSSFLSSDQNEIGAMTETLQRLKLIAAHNKHHVVLLHHARKRTSNDPKYNRKMILDDVRGSSAISASCDFILAVSNIFTETGEKVKGAGILHPIKEGAVGGEMEARFEEFNYKFTNEKTGSLCVNYWYGDEGYHVKSIQTTETGADKDSQILLFLYKNTNCTSTDLLNAISNITGNKTRQSIFDMVKLRDNGLINFEKKGRTKFYYLTEKGIKTIDDYSIGSIKELTETDSIKEIIADTSIKRAMEDHMAGEPIKLTDEQIKAWYRDRSNYDDPKEYPVDTTELYTDEQSIPYALKIANLLWSRCDRDGNMWMSNLNTFLEEDRGTYNHNMFLQIIKSMIDHEQIWFHLYYENSKLKDIILHPSSKLGRKFDV
jgi:DNA-binding PadR family transcriptional regulator